MLQFRAFISTRSKIYYMYYVIHKIRGFQISWRRSMTTMTSPILHEGDSIKFYLKKAKFKNRHKSRGLVNWKCLAFFSKCTMYLSIWQAGHKIHFEWAEQLAIVLSYITANKVHYSKQKNQWHNSYWHCKKYDLQDSWPQTTKWIFLRLCL